DARLVAADEAGDGRDVVGDGHVREEADLLDHVADLTPQLDGGQLADAAAVDPDVALVEGDQAVDHLQRSRLAAARRPDEDAEGSPGDRQPELPQPLLVTAPVTLPPPLPHHPAHP